LTLEVGQPRAAGVAWEMLPILITSELTLPSGSASSQPGQDPAPDSPCAGGSETSPEVV